MREIKITDIENIKLGNAQDTENATGCTVAVSYTHLDVYKRQSVSGT